MIRNGFDHWLLNWSGHCKITIKRWQLGCNDVLSTVGCSAPFKSYWLMNSLWVAYQWTHNKIRFICHIHDCVRDWFLENCGKGCGGFPSSCSIFVYFPPAKLFSCTHLPHFHSNTQWLLPGTQSKYKVLEACGDIFLDIFFFRFWFTAQQHITQLHVTAFLIKLIAELEAKENDLFNLCFIGPCGPINYSLVVIWVTPSCSIGRHRPFRYKQRTIHFI